MTVLLNWRKVWKTKTKKGEGSICKLPNMALFRQKKQADNS